MSDRTTTGTVVLVYGASGYVGRAVCSALENRGATVLRRSAPRLPKINPSEVSSFVTSFDVAVEALVAQGQRVDVMINSAGIADAGSKSQEELLAANGALPGILGRVAVEAGVARYVHVSSAAVQGSVAALSDQVAQRGFSPYSTSKLVGEKTAQEYGPVGTVIYRPPGVHDETRRMTQSLARFARSRLSSVVAPGTQGTPQALLKNVADAVAALAMHPTTPPRIVSHPPEGISVRSLLSALGCREPLIIPRMIGVPIVAILKVISGVLPNIRANVRRLEVLWLGQEQVESWLPSIGWFPVQGHECWRIIGENIERRDSGAKTRRRLVVKVDRASRSCDLRESIIDE